MTSSPLSSATNALLQAVVVADLIDGKKLKGRLISATPTDITIEMGPNDQREHVRLALSDVVTLTPVK